MAEDFSGLPHMDFKGMTELPNEEAKKAYIRNYVHQIFQMADQAEYLQSVVYDAEKYASIFSNGLLRIYKELDEGKNPDIKSIIIGIFQEANPDKKVTHEDVMQCIHVHENMQQQQ